MPINPEYFINSGCILGRRKEMKNLLNYSMIYNNIIRDDQQIMIRYYLMFPYIVSLDVFHDFSFTAFQQNLENSHFYLFENYELYSMNGYYYYPDYRPQQKIVKKDLSHDDRRNHLTRENNLTSQFSFMSHGLIHANLVLSSTLYYYLYYYIKNYYDSYYNGSIAETVSSPLFSSVQTMKGLTNFKRKKLQMLLKIVWSVNDRQFEKALQLLDEVEKEFKSYSVKRFNTVGSGDGEDIVLILRKFIKEGIFSGSSTSRK
jgi:hypothetical protein